MNKPREMWTEGRIAGGLLAGSLPIIALALIILITSGARPASSAYFRREYAQAAPHAATFRLLFLLSALGWLAQTLGLGLLSRLLQRAGVDQPAVLAFTLALVAAALVVIWATFRMSVELWAVQEAARTGKVPELFIPLQEWSNSFLSFANVTYLAAGAIFGYGIVRSGILSPAMGWFGISGSVLFLVAFAFGVRVPAIPVTLPALIGVAFLLR